MRTRFIGILDHRQWRVRSAAAKSARFVPKIPLHPLFRTKTVFLKKNKVNQQERILCH
jgi:hypothetical protein